MSQTCRICVFPGAQNLPLWYMQKNFPETMLDLQYTSSRDEQFQLLNDRQVDLIYTAPDNLLQDDAKDIEMIHPAAMMPLYLMATPGFRERQRLAVDHPASGYALIAYQAVQSIGLSLQDIEVVSAGGTRQRYEAMLHGKAELGLLHAPFSNLAQANDWFILAAPSLDDPLLVAACLSEHRHSPLIENFLNQYQQAVEKIVQPETMETCEQLLQQHMSNLSPSSIQSIAVDIRSQLERLPTTINSDEQSAWLNRLWERRKHAKWPERIAH
ncbi:hypothetical protein FY534_04305 [Alicyclobacillus sp. TC]|uniref:hypothetical protein n=1 Tax=Alicyclobacillus sp. TC TaxID=2606450 RepID=UPI0019346CA4|nr:hypothetical protein [Alicyclobacillus sp. TC]QRF22987.1 hypothetical protein FY534_04305 [Alicyclobacillus sp. TC]